MFSLININEVTSDQYEHYYSLLSDEKRARVDRFRFNDDKKRTVCGEMLARQMIAEQYGVKEENLSFAVTGHGKPYLINSAVHFNISHSADYVLCAVSNVPIGADIEKMKPIENRLIHAVCTDAEENYVLNSADLLDRQRRFFRIWTAKEAYFKCCGTGITDLKGVCILEEPLCRTKNLYYEDYAISIFENQSLKEVL